MNKLEKDKSSIRTYDKDGFIKRAACICVNDSETQVLLVTSSSDSSLWIVPGGGIEPDEMPETAAIREVREEAGVEGMLGRCLGVFENSERGHRTSVYVLVVTEEMEEWDDARNIGRRRKWFSVEEAVEKLAMHRPVQSDYVRLLLSQSSNIKKGNHECSTVKDTNCCLREVNGSGNKSLNDVENVKPVIQSDESSVL